MYFPSCRHNAPLPQSCAPPDPATAAVAERWIIAYLVVLLCEFDRRVDTEESVKERTCEEAARAQRTASARQVQASHGHSVVRESPGVTLSRAGNADSGRRVPI
jgi:hypothetical protein